jgi:hypothetical protein
MGSSNMNKAIYLSAILGSLAVGALAAESAPAAADAGKSVAAAAPAKNWSPYAAVATPAQPAVKQKAWVRAPLDAFVLAQIEAKGLKPSPETDRATYIRRATLDAWGLLPTPEEIQAFVSDKSPKAYDKLVDRLLASPHFGERQARRWLDLARYADSTGFQNDNTRPNNWRYRDYVINAFNEDKPFSQFIQEQIAGDELWPSKQEARIATGFLAGYPDNANSRDLVQRKYQIATDMTDLVGEAFLGSTVGCARCHNHKSDKVSQKEYFQLQAYFANTSFDERAPLAKGTETDWDKAFENKQSAYNEATKDIRAKQKAILDSVREAGRKYHNERYLTDSRDAIFKPQEQWTSQDRWVNWRLKSVASDADIVAFLREFGQEKERTGYDPVYAEKLKQYNDLTAELKKFDNIKPASGSRFLTAATELGHGDAPPTFVRFGGIHERPLEEVQPAIPALWTGKNQPVIKASAETSGRRTALAQWLSDASNPLTPRVYANRVWAQYFDKGIVATLHDFGRAGAKPTHPELLDHLASSFVSNGWSVKKLHREILLSATYRQSSNERPDAVKVDPENKLLAVYPRKRLEAEEIRDSLLYASGLLVDKVGGPSVVPPVVKAGLDVGKSQDFNGNRAWAVSDNKEDWYRRSIYIFNRRSFPYPVTQSFDPADPSKPHHKRDVTTTPLQALTLFNSDVVFDWSQALAGRVINEAGANEDAQLNRLYQTLFARLPDTSERKALKEFLVSEQIVIKQKAANGKFDVAIPVGLKDTKSFDPVKSAAFVDLVHAVANSNDFAYRF